MKHVSLLAVLLFAAQVGLAAAPVNFKVATIIDSREESLDRPRPYITVDARKLCFTQPPFTELSSNPQSLTVYLAKSGQSGQVAFSNSSFKTDVDLLAQMDDYLKAAEATIPKEAKDVEFKGSNNHLYFVNDFKSIAFDWSYSLYGHPTHRQIAFINIDPLHQICLTVLSDEESSGAALAAAKRLICSSFWADGAGLK